MITPKSTAHSHSSACRPAETVPEGGTPATPDTLWRRYSEFELLRTYLLVTYPYIIIPPLPEKRVSGTYVEGEIQLIKKDELHVTILLGMTNPCDS